MDRTLHAGAARRTINPPLGTGKIGGRLFGDPIQAIESDLTATALVLGGVGTKIVILAVDLCTVDSQLAGGLRADVAGALGPPVAHVMLNESHDHSASALLPRLVRQRLQAAVPPGSERRAVEGTLAVIGQLTE